MQEIRFHLNYCKQFKLLMKKVLFPKFPEKRLKDIVLNYRRILKKIV